MNWWRRLRHRPPLEQRLDDELQFHVDRLAADYIDAGLSTKAARRTARLNFGGVQQAKEGCRDVRGGRWVDTMLLDVRFAARLLHKSPLFSTITVLTLALGIGATTSMFSIVNSVLLRLPFSSPGRLTRFTAFDPDHQIPLEVSYVEINEWRQATRSFDDIAGIGSTNWSYVLEGADPVTLHPVVVSGNFFNVLGSHALLGHTLTPDDDRPGQGRVAVLSHALWQTRFGGDPTIVGRAIRLSGSPFTIAGVMPPDFHYPPGADIWTPIAPELEAVGRRHGQDLLGMREFAVLHGIGRLKPGVSLEDAQSDLSQLIRRDTLKNGRVQLTPLVDDYFGRLRWGLLVALAAVFLLLTIACSNVAGLLLARVARRRQEWALRRALGGTTTDIARSSIAETVLIAVPASVVGIAMVPGLVALIVALDPTHLLSGYPIQTDFRVLALSVAVSTATVVFASAWPALQAVAVQASDSVIALRLRHRPSISRARRWLVVGQVALALFLLASTGLMIRSVMNVSRLDLGFNANHLLVVSGSELDDVSRERHDAVVEEIVSGIRTLPGVESASGVYRAPLQGPIGLDVFVTKEGDPLSHESLTLHPAMNAEGVTPDYFSTMGIPLIAGRAFTSADRFETAGVTIVSQAVAQLLWPGQNALGQHMLSFSRKPLRLSDGRLNWDTVIGVAADVRYREIEHSRFDVYLPVTQADAPAHDIVIRTHGDPLDVARSVQAMIRRIMPTSPTNIRTMTSMLADVTAVWRMVLVILSAFALFAVFLTATALYGLTAYLVEERTHEIGIRIALGAASTQIRSLIVTSTVRLVFAGLTLGLVISVVASGLMRTLVFGVGATDPIALTSAAGLLALVALGATVIPSRRATRIDAMLALRAE